LEGPRDGQTEGRTRLGSEACCQASRQRPDTRRGKENRRLTQDCAQSRPESHPEGRCQGSNVAQGAGTAQQVGASTGGCQGEDTHRPTRCRQGQAHGEGEAKGSGSDQLIGTSLSQSFGEEPWFFDEEPSFIGEERSPSAAHGPRTESRAANHR
jgi:hypothetical protein